MTASADGRPFSDHPYSDLPTGARRGARPRAQLREHGCGALCPEAQADGVPCFELGRRCETCEHAYGWVLDEAPPEQ
jgi:hypothetical protein